MASPDARPSARGQFRRAERYKGTRRYLRDYQAGFNANPKVRRAQARKMKGERAYARTPAGPRKAAALRAMLAGRAGMEREYRRGLDPIAAEIYKRYGKELWGRAKRFYPEPERRPRMRVDYGPESKRYGAWVNPVQPNLVHVSPREIREFTQPKGRRGASEIVLLHEWAHTRQPRGLFVKTPAQRAAREGGAEALSQALARKLGIHYVQPSQQYQGYRRQAKRKGRRYIRKGQFQR